MGTDVNFSTPVWRTFRRRVTSVTIEELRLLFDWSLPGPRLYRLAQKDRFYVMAKVDVETDEPAYPYRPSEHREVSGGRGARIRREFPCQRVGEFRCPTGHFTTWLKNDEIRHALAHNRLIQCHDVFIAVINDEHRRRWAKLRRQMLRLYGCTCMRCSRATGQMQIDHIKLWSKYPDGRYDLKQLPAESR